MENQELNENDSSQGESLGEIEVNYSQDQDIEAEAADEVIESVDNINNKQEPLSEKPPGKNKKKIIIGLVLLIVSLLIIGGGAFGYIQYDKYFSEIEIEEILPGEVDFVAQLVIDPESSQFKNLETNLQKFPGYNILKKELDEAGEGKTLSEVIQDSLKEKNLDFQNDIKPVLTGSAYIIIPSLENLTDGVQDNIRISSKNILNELNLEGSAKNKIAFDGAQRDVGDPRILGQSKELYVSQDNEAISIEATDFIIASKINDIKKAKEVLDKIEVDGQYEFVKSKHQGYQYYQINLKEEIQENLQFFNYKKTYHALLGGNWVMSSNEADIKLAIERKSQQDLFSKSSNDNASLLSNIDYQKIKSNLKAEGEDVLFSIYFNIKDPVTDSEVDSFIKSPESVIGGFSLDVEEDGFLFRGSSNNINSKDLQNFSKDQSLANMLPQKIDQKWADGFFEYGNPKELYYNFKKNNVTREGLDKWNMSLDDINNTLGLDLEKDFIDLIEGKLAFLLLTSKDVAPSGALVVEINDSEKMVNTMKKIVETLKLVQIGYVTGTMEQLVDPIMKKQYENKIVEIQNSQIEEKEISSGLIYSYTIPMEEIEGVIGTPLAISFSAENNKFVLGYEMDVVEEITGGLQSNLSGKLADNQFYQLGTKHYHSDNYANSYINTMGIWNIVGYAFKQIKNVQMSFQQELCNDPEFKELQPEACPEAISTNNDEDEYLLAIGAVLRTLKSVGISNSVEEDFLGFSMFLNVEELSIEEKDRANRTLELM